VHEPTAPFGVFNGPDGERYQSDWIEICDEAFSHHIRKVSASQGLSPARLFHAAWALVVAHTSKRDDVVFGTILRTVRPRDDPMQSLVGMFVNTLPFRLQLRDISAAQLLEGVQRELSEILRYKHTSLTRIQNCSNIHTDRSLFTSILNFRRSASIPVAPVDCAADIEVLAIREAYSHFPVALTVQDTGQCFELKAQTHRSIDPITVTHFTQMAMRRLLGALESDPSHSAMALANL
jgi:non-ribosomal peptide synthetase component F